MSAEYKVAAERILAEAERAAAKFPPFNSTHEGWAVTWEELDEAWDEVRANNLDKAVEEMVQVGAMALRFVAEFQRAVDGAS